MDGGDGLEPDGLPDAGGAIIPDGARLGVPVLLAARLGEVGGLVFGADDDDLLGVAGLQGSGDVGAEGGLTAFVLGDEGAVDPDVRDVVDSPEVEDEPLPAIFGGDAEGTAIPDDGVEGGVGDAAGAGLGGVGDDNGAVEGVWVRCPLFVQPGVGIVIGKLPGAAEV